MHYDIQLGFLAADAISEFSRAARTKEPADYEAFLEQTTSYCREFRSLHSRPVETDISAAMPQPVADFMRAVVKTRPPTPAVAVKLEAVGAVEKLLQSIREEQRQPSDNECLRIARTIYSTSAAEPR